MLRPGLVCTYSHIQLDVYFASKVSVTFESKLACNQLCRNGNQWMAFAQYPQCTVCDPAVVEVAVSLPCSLLQPLMSVLFSV